MDRGISKAAKRAPIITPSDDILEEDQKPPSSAGVMVTSDDEPKLPSTINVPARSSYFLSTEGGEGSFADRQEHRNSSEDSLDDTCDEKKKRSYCEEEDDHDEASSSAACSSASSLTDDCSWSSSKLSPCEQEKRRRIEFLGTGLKTTNKQLIEENRKLRKIIEAIKVKQNK